MKRTDKWTSMLIFLEKTEHRKLKDVCLKNGTFPHRVLVEMVRHLNETGLPSWLLKACIRGHEASKSKSGRPRLDKTK